MGFLDDILGVFTGDIFYPDNVKRAARFRELQMDCASFLEQEKESSARTQEAIAKLDSRLQQAFASIQLPTLLTPEAAPLPPEFQPLPRLLLPLAQMQPVRDGCAMAASLSAVGWQSSVSAILGLSIITQRGDMIFGIPQEILSIGPLRGAQRRDNLRHAIRASVAARFQIRRLVEARTQLLEAVQVVQNTLDAVDGISNLPMDRLMEDLVRQITALQQIVGNLDNVVWQWLSRYDTFRQSWTAEDR